MLPPFVSKQNIYKTREASVCLNLPLPPQVEESQLRRFPRDRERLTAQLSFDIVEFHVRHERRLELTCLSTIPGSLDPEQSEYADRKSSSVTGRAVPVAGTTHRIDSLKPGSHVCSVRTAQWARSVPGSRCAATLWLPVGIMQKHTHCVGSLSGCLVLQRLLLQ